jgi:hypothetical protein
MSYKLYTITPQTNITHSINCVWSHLIKNNNYYTYTHKKKKKKNGSHIILIFQIKHIIIIDLDRYSV